MKIPHVDGYKHIGNKTKSGWIEFHHPVTAGFINRVQILVNEQGQTFVHDALNRPVELNDTILAAAIKWWKKEAPKNCRFYFGHIHV